MWVENEKKKKSDFRQPVWTKPKRESYLLTYTSSCGARYSLFRVQPKHFSSPGNKQVLQEEQQGEWGKHRFILLPWLAPGHRGAEQEGLWSPATMTKWKLTDRKRERKRKRGRDVKQEVFQEFVTNYPLWNSQCCQTSAHTLIRKRERLKEKEREEERHSTLESERRERETEYETEERERKSTGEV